jgi:hypothetical protein
MALKMPLPEVPSGPLPARGAHEDIRRNIAMATAAKRERAFPKKGPPYFLNWSITESSGVIQESKKVRTGRERKYHYLMEKNLDINY